MREIVNKQNVTIIIPHTVAMDLNTLLGQGSLRLTMEGVPRYKDTANPDNPMMIAGIESIEELFIEELLKHYGKDGYDLSWNNVVNSPYIELPKNAVIPKDLLVYSDAHWVNDTHQLIRIYGNVVNDESTYPCTFKVLKDWVDEFGIDKIISTPIDVSDKLNDYYKDIV